MTEAPPRPDVQVISPVPLVLPEKRILSRLGYNVHLTKVDAGQRGRIERVMHEGFSLCKLTAAWTRLSILRRDPDAVTLMGGYRIESVKLAEFLGESRDIVLLAATAGDAIIPVIDGAVLAEDTMRAAVLDATASESVDEALNWLQSRLRQRFVRVSATITEGRFSPGYGDLGLEAQRLAYELLQLERLGVTITDRFQLMPEKTVIGFAGLA